MDEKVSIIVPVYNAEGYLVECYNSIAMQTYKNIEIVFVNDGSTDNSLRCCWQFAQKDSRVSVYSQNNRGQNSARKLGVNKAKGKYIAFCDADDIMQENMIEILYSIMKKQKVSIVNSGYIRFFDSDYEQYKLPNVCGKFTGREVIGFIFDSSNWKINIMVSLYASLFEKKILSAINVIDERIDYSEDYALFVMMLINNPDVYIVKSAYYKQRVHSMSFTNVHNKSNYQSQLLLYSFLDSYVSSQVTSYERNSIMKEIASFVIRDLLIGGYDYFANKYDSIFPFCDVGKDDEIILYGAGQFGSEIYYKSGANIVAWCDKYSHDMDGVKLISIEDIKRYKYKYILISILNRDIANEVEQELVSYGVSKSKIKQISQSGLVREVECWISNGEK